MLVAYGLLAMLVICDVDGWILTWILGPLALWKICVIGLDEFIHDACGTFCGYVYILFHESCQNFVGMSMDKFVGMEKNSILAMEKFCWVFDVRSWTTFMIMILDM